MAAISHSGGARAEARALVRAAFAPAALAALAADADAAADVDGSPDALPPPPAGLAHLPARRPSRAAGGGEYGLYVRGGCRAGALVALYPGVVYEVSDLPMMHGHLLHGNFYVVTRRDGVLVDGRQAPPSSSVFEMAAARERASGREPPAPPSGNPWACGHFANHPPAGAADNARLLPLDLTAEDLESIGRRWVPNVNFRPPAAGDPLALRTVALVALKPIAHGEEVLLDYRLSSAPEQRPPWYQPVDRGRAPSAE